MNKKIKIFEWNINQRLNFEKKDIPIWLVDVLLENNADIIVITECFVGNNWNNIKQKLHDNEYLLFESQNQRVNNDIAIAVKKDIIIVKSVTTIPSLDHTSPDHLEIACSMKHKDDSTDKEIDFYIVGIRIHAMKITDKQKFDELSCVLERLREKEKVIIAGDFNNNRRGYNAKNAWNLASIDNLINQYNFTRYTPSGSSIYQEIPFNKNKDYEFPEDHFFVKGIDKSNIILHPYNRDFVKNDRTIYKWGNDFQSYQGKINGQNKYDSIPAPYPDHAILICEIEI